MYHLRCITRKIRSKSRSLYLELWPKPGATTVLFYPGSLLSPYQYRTLFHALHRAGLAVAALHLTGHGKNQHWTLFAFSDLLEDGLYAENWLRYEGYGSIVICGHSQGGILTLAHAAASSTVVGAFPITGVLPQTPEAIGLTHFQPLAKHRTPLIQSIAAWARLVPRLPVPLQAYLSTRRILAAAHGAVVSKRKMRWTYPLAYLDSLFRTTIPPRIGCPLCFFSAPDDALFTPDIILRTYERLTAPSRRLVWLPSGGHLAVFTPSICRYLANTLACVCAGWGLPLRCTGLHSAGGRHGV
ncbi:MAG: alpha/beta fold hydrolase [Desulfovibrio sp.]|nr:alpha/beta fold hydrolase [Desulfovibrio sp.]